MPTITEIRKQYPQYGDMSDQQLADALHSKFYADMPADQFYSKIGFKAAAPAAPKPAARTPSYPEQVVRSIKNQTIDNPRSKEPFDYVGGIKSAVGEVGRDLKEMGAPPKGPLDFNGSAAVARLPLDAVGAASSLTGIPQAVQYASNKTGIDLNTALSAMGPEGRVGAMMAKPELAAVRERAVKPGLDVHDAEMAAKRQGHIKLLEREGVEIPAGRRHGGTADTLESIGKSSIYTRKGLMDAEDHSLRSMNVALYNRALKPLGETYKGSAATVGRDGIGYLKNRFDASYGEWLPKARMKFDDKLVDQIADVANEASVSKDKGDRFNKIIEQRVLRQFGSGEISGRTYKTMEEGIGKLAANYKGSADPEDRALGMHLDEVLGHIRENMERHSPPEVSAALKRTNEGYAIFSRLRDAAAARKMGGGVITPGDLQGAIKRGDKTVGKGAFARGDARLQDFGDAAAAILPDKLNDSGTELRGLAHGRGLIGAGIGGAVGGVPGAAAGAAADLAASHVTNRIARELALTQSRKAISAAKKAAAEKAERAGRSVISQRHIEPEE